MSLKARQRLSNNDGSGTLFLNTEPQRSWEIGRIIEIPETTANQEEKIDEFHTPKKLTIITERMIRKFSGSVSRFKLLINFF